MQKTTSKRWVRFGLRTLMVVVALLAVSLVFGPKLWRRHQLNQAIDSAVDQDPTYWESYNVLESLATNKQSDDGDLEFALRKLFQIVESGTDEERRAWTLNILRMLIGRSGSIELREVYLGELVRPLTSDCRFLATTEVLVAQTIATWISSTGLSQDQRAALLEAAKQIPPERRPNWVCILGSIGGRKETMLMLEWGEFRDERLLWQLRLELAGSRWAGLLPYFERSMDEPSIVELPFESFALSHTTEGRRMLLASAVDRSNPPHVRRKAIEHLKRTVIGIEMLLDACDDQSRRTVLSEAINDDVHSTLKSALEERTQYNGEILWSELIAELDHSYWSPSALSALQRFSGVTEISSKEEWQAWYDRTKPGIVSQREILELVLEQPEFVENSTIMTRIVPDHLGYVPENCLPLYEQMLRSGNSTLRCWACEALLAYTDNKAAVPVAIELIGQSERSPSAAVEPKPIYILRKQFAVNFFWDVSAWERWWDEHRTEN